MKANMWPSDYGESLFFLGNLLIYFHKFDLNKNFQSMLYFSKGKLVSKYLYIL